MSGAITHSITHSIINTDSLLKALILNFLKNQFLRNILKPKIFFIFILIDVKLTQKISYCYSMNEFLLKLYYSMIFMSSYKKSFQFFIINKY
jgi:hypothetical protein